MVSSEERDFGSNCASSRLQRMPIWIEAQGVSYQKHNIKQKHMRSNINKYSFGSIPNNLYWITWARMLDLLDPWALGCIDMAPVTPHGPFLFLSLSSHLYKHLNSPNPKLFSKSPPPPYHRPVSIYILRFDHTDDKSHLPSPTFPVCPGYPFQPCATHLNSNCFTYILNHLGTIENLIILEQGESESPIPNSISPKKQSCWILIPQTSVKVREFTCIVLYNFVLKRCIIIQFMLIWGISIV